MKTVVPLLVRVQIIFIICSLNVYTFDYVYLLYAEPIILAHINTFHYFLKGRFAVQIYGPNKFEKHGSGVSFLETFPSI